MPAPSNTPDKIDTLSFEEVDIRWTVLQVSGERRRFDTLGALQEALDIGEITLDSALTFDGNVWRVLSDIPDLRAYFWQVWKRAQRGEIRADWMPTIGGGIDDEAPTTLARPDQDLSEALKQVLSEELMARSKAFVTPPVTAQPPDPSAEPEPMQAPEPAAPPPAPPPAHHEPAPAPSDIPSLLRGMAISLSLVAVALLLLLTL